MGPVIKTMVQNMTPVSTAQCAMVSHLESLRDKYKMLAMKVIKNAKYARKAEGTWM